MRSRRLVALISLLTLLLVVVAAPVTQAAGGKDRFIVVLKDSVISPVGVATKHGKKYDADVDHVYKHALKGYSAKLSRAEVAELRADPQVRFVERDGIASIDRARAKGKKGGAAAAASSAAPTWGIDRIDERGLPLSGTYTYTAPTGAGRHRLHHRHRGARDTRAVRRAVSGTNTVNDGHDPTDCNGHGTHVAGTVGRHHLRRRQGR